MSEIPTQGGHYEMTDRRTGDVLLVWVYVSPRAGACVRRGGSLGAERVTSRFLNRYRLRGPILAPDGVAKEVR